MERHYELLYTQNGIKPPQHYSTNATLTSDDRIMMADSMFPSKVFDGKNIPVVEFLYEVNRAQANLNLNRQEFQMYLVRGTTGEAFTTVSQSFEVGLTIENVYQQLFMFYRRIADYKLPTRN